ncbi:hypothetical protein A2963_04145 [Candidatus Roizmanbacteria bacterium RIFCSPLOWO2_01_FULL_40_13]|nr:MAG: hypothetical protein A2963_04145 [Candidatus Roizmanbacteria bacterium RIFCSPLOWO2_01_FULL_40_13]
MENESKTVYMMANKNTKTIYQVFKDGGTKKVITLQRGSPRMEGLSFRSGDRLNIIWGGSPNTGNIYRINLNNGSVETVLDSNIWVKTIAWDNNGVKLYVSTRNKLLRFSYNNDGSITKDNYNVSLPGPTDAMDMTTDGYIVGGYKSGGKLHFYFLNPANRSVLSRRSIDLTGYDQQLSSQLSRVTRGSNCSYKTYNLDAFTWLCGARP